MGISIGKAALAAVAVGGVVWFGYNLVQAYRRVYGDLRPSEELEEESKVDVSPTNSEAVTETIEVVREYDRREYEAPLDIHWGFDLSQLDAEAYGEITWMHPDEEDDDYELYMRVRQRNDKVIGDYLKGLEELKAKEEYIATLKGDVELDMLKYDKDSYDALNQFKDLLLIDFEPESDEYQILSLLLEINVLLDAPGDETTHAHIAERRKQFFGEDSIWVNDWTWGEVLIYYASRASYDLQEYSYMEYVEDWIRDYGLDPFEDDVNGLTTDLNSNAYDYNGIFGFLSLYDYDVDNHMKNYGYDKLEDVSLEVQYQIWLDRKLKWANGNE